MKAEVIDLINADIDGEISTEDRAVLEDQLDQNADAKSYHSDLSSLCNELDTMESVEPPPHLKHVILNTAPRPKNTAAKPAGSGLRAMLDVLFGGHVARYAMSFGIGAILAFSFINPDQIGRQGMDDMTGMVGTIGLPDQRQPFTQSGIVLDLDQVTGSVLMSSTDSGITLNFDLASNGPIEIVASFADDDVWLSGYSQQKGEGTMISANQGDLRVKMQGERSYEVYLNKGNESSASVELNFYSDGSLIHQEQLRYSQ
jgi:hypothetical protein